MESTIALHLGTFCPYITYNCAVALLWLSAFFFTLPYEDGSGESEAQWAHQQQRMFSHTVASILGEIEKNANWTAALTTDLLLVYLKLLAAVSERVKHLMLPDFCTLLVSLYTTHPDKTDVAQLEPLLLHLLVHVDVHAEGDTVFHPPPPLSTPVHNHNPHTDVQSCTNEHTHTHTHTLSP